MTDWRHHYQNLAGFHEEANDRASAKCPFHEDRKASLRLNLRTGWAECFAGCGKWGPTDFAAQTGLPAPSGNGRGGNGKAPSGSGDRWISYIYTNHEGRPIFRVSRTPEKGFPQSHWDGHAWQKGLTRADGSKVTRVLYRLQELAAADPDEPVWITEGEKDADNLASLGLVATTFAGGAGKSPLTPDEEIQVLAGRRVYVLPDHDGPGEEHAATVLPQLRRVGAIPHLLDTVLPGKDVSDWLAAGGTRAALVDLAANCPPWSPTIPALTLAEAAQLAGVHPRTLQRAVQSGALPATAEERPQGTRYTVARRDLEAWVGARDTEPCRVEKDATEDATEDVSRGKGRDTEPCRVEKDATGTLQGDAAGSCSVATRMGSVTNVTPPGHTYHRTHLGNAELLRDMFGTRLRYCHPWATWLYWTGQRWKRDDCGFAKDCASQVARQRLADAHGAGERDDIKRELAWAFSSENTAGINGTLALAQCIADLTVLPDEFDDDPWALNLLNGTLDLRTGKLHRHDPEAYHTKLCPVRWNPEATCPTWKAFLERVLPSETLRAYVQRAAGYSLTGVIREHVMFLCYGTGANGKSTCFEAFARLLGGYSRTIQASLLTGDRRSAGPDPELAELRGARFVRASESDENARLSEGFIKAATGGDTITARRCYEDPTEFAPSHKLWLGTNHRPQIRGVDLGIWRRIKMIPWTVTIPREEQDPGLLDAIMREQEGILAWLVEGCMAWRQHGLGEAQEVAQATEEYRLDSDIFGQFLAERCILREGIRTDATTLRNAYNAWRAERGEREITAYSLARALRDRGLQRLRNGSSMWIGIGVRYIHEGIPTMQICSSMHTFPEVPHEEKRDQKLRETMHMSAGMHTPGPATTDPLQELLGEGIL